MDFNHGAELTSLDFDKLIGGPLAAVIKAQCQANLVTTNFIKEFGFKKSEAGSGSSASKVSEPLYVEFTYEKPGLFGMPMRTSIRVPILTMLPIPSLRVELVEIDFLAKITSQQTFSVDSMSASGSSYSADWNASSNSSSWWSQRRANSNSSASFQCGSVNQRTTKKGATITRDYSLKVHVRAVQDAVPPGLDRIMKTLEKTIEEKPDETMTKLMGQAMGNAFGGANNSASTAPATPANQGSDPPAQNSNQRGFEWPKMSVTEPDS